MKTLKQSWQEIVDNYFSKIESNPTMSLIEKGTIKQLLSYFGNDFLEAVREWLQQQRPLNIADWQRNRHVVNRFINTLLEELEK